MRIRRRRRRRRAIRSDRAHSLGPFVIGARSRISALAGRYFNADIKRARTLWKEKSAQLSTRTPDDVVVLQRDLALLAGRVTSVDAGSPVRG